MKAFWAAENVTAALHNIYTLSGAPVREALRWSKYINEALYLFGMAAEVLFASHHWPRWGNKRVQEILNTLVHAEPSNQEAKDLLADVFEQLAYQQENPGLRQSCLAGAPIYLYIDFETDFIVTNRYLALNRSDLPSWGPMNRVKSIGNYRPDGWDS